ncbi:alpha-amylase family protein [Actinomyces succiniciruminis]|uniref:Cyclomaltodextrinase n=1 Tax=Actinomyces succiniciruminis TaxID=1522002 RepID=A0A1L7RAN6_9ACTO|nr:alpha-amylase family protein [Actinomyces succiniciruminis]CED90917.1 Cyclomaltodextrinase [Actinomyces succiniciruminis]
MSSWSDSCIWWHVYPLGFTGAPIRPTEAERVLTPRLDALEPWLDYLIALGANGLALGPIFTSETHGYDTVDFYSIDPRLGDDAAFDRLIAACRRRGINVMLDGVFNHVGTAHPSFRAAMAGDERAQELFRLEHTDAGVTHQDFEGHRGLAALNHDSDAVVELVADVMRHWLRRGAMAWRLDAAYAVPPEFWARVLPRVREEFPEAWFMGEVIHGDYADIVTRSGMDSVTQYELWKAIWSSLLDENFFELDWCLKRHNELLAAFTPLTFIGNHDVTRIATRLGGAKAALAVVLLLTVGGIPSIYYGDEQAFRGEKTERLGGDDDVRPAFPAGPEQLSPLGAPMLRLYQDLIALRRRNPWLATATTVTRHLDNRAYSYDTLGPDGQRLAVELRLEPAPVAVVTAPDGQVLRIGGDAGSGQ